MGTKADFSEKVKIWQLYYLQNTPIDRIRQEVKWDNAVTPSWNTVKRVIDEFRALTQAQVGELSDALQARWRELQSQIDAKQREPTEPPYGETRTTALERSQVRELIQRAREEVASYSPTQLLQRWLDEASENALSRFLTDEDTKMLYLEARRPHFETFHANRLCLRVESDPMFGLLRQKFTTATVWVALEAWGEQALPYLRAFYHMLDAPENAAHSALDEQGIDDSNLSEFITRCKMERLYAVLLTCDLLARGLAELPGNPHGALLGSDLERLRLRVNLELSLLTKNTPKGGWPSGIKDICAYSWDLFDPLEETRPFLNELVKLQSIQDSLAIPLQELESKI